MKQEYYEEEMMVKEAITAHKSDQEIGMPDIEQELKRVKQMARRKQPLLMGWRKVAAIAALVICIGGLAGTFVYYQHSRSEENNPASVAKKTTTEVGTQTESMDNEEEVKASEHLTLTYEKASLEQIVIDLTAYYQLQQPVFENRKAARKNKMHITINPKGTIEEAVALLNQFGRIRIELSDNRIVVK